MPGAPAPMASADRVTHKSAPWRVRRVTPGAAVELRAGAWGQVVGAVLGKKVKKRVVMAGTALRCRAAHIAPTA